MKTVDKLFLLLYLLLLTAILVFAAFIPTGYISTDLVETIVYGLQNGWIVSVIALILVVVNLVFMAALFRGNKVQKFGVVKLTSAGEINISNETIRSLVLKTAGQIKGVRDIKVMIRPGRDNIGIHIKVLILPDINIPQTVKEMQETVKAYVETVAEVPVGEVKVAVMDVASGTKLRVE